ncbi:MAG: iron-containing redox enzyme family protein [Methylococcales symbiont of Hymedesmia sp. n. MRB-2018]|nr:MAG: iron-containing redox enzyme family protein [Methylococcales symbiont of Hymedesmia sp. n. MRB-2018]
MNNREHVFSPTFETSLSKPSFDDLSSVDNIDARQLFYLLNQPEKQYQVSNLAYDFICYKLNVAKHFYDSSIDHCYDVKSIAQLKITKIAPLAQHFSVLDNQLECVRQTTAIQLSQPYWLKNTFQVSCSQNKIALQLMSLFHSFNVNDQEKISLDVSYRSLLLRLGVKQPLLYTQEFAQQEDILEEVFNFSSIQLSLMQFPRLLFPEILGFTLAFLQMPTLIEICFPDHQLNSDFFKQRQQKIEIQIKVLFICITDYLALFKQQNDKLWSRIQYGFFLFQQQILSCRDQLSQLFDKQQTIEQKIAFLFQQKAIAALGHHQNIILEGVSLDHWFSNMPDNSEAFLQALKNSKFVDVNQPDNSKLLKLFDFKGPMLGVLNNKERKLLLRWLKSDGNILLTTQAVEKDLSNASLFAKVLTRQTTTYQKINNRELYYYLVNADLFPDVLLTVTNKTKRLLQVCDFFSHVPFKKYSHEQFDKYIAEIYHNEMKAYQPLQGQPKISKPAYLWGLEQIAPMILIDGCWLQNSLAIKQTNAGISEILFSIYRDEIGNGVLQQSHPYIFKQLLDSLSIMVPAVHSKDFINHPRFINSAFDLPVYMLALSYFPIQFLPELLGLNMAIELSGLGKSYMQLVDDWRYWDIDPTIASIHISIDNYASGHTYLAKKAIKLYLDQIQNMTADNVIVDKHWRRICCGYSSLRFVGTRFKLAMPATYLANKYSFHQG